MEFRLNWFYFNEDRRNNIFLSYYNDNMIMLIHIVQHVSHQCLRYHLEKYGLTRPNVASSSSAQDIIEVILEEMKGPNSVKGYKQMHEILLRKHHLYMPR